jgi:hypothetical protein
LRQEVKNGQTLAEKAFLSFNHEYKTSHQKLSKTL